MTVRYRARDRRALISGWHGDAPDVAVADDFLGQPPHDIDRHGDDRDG